MKGALIVIAAVVLWGMHIAGVLSRNVTTSPTPQTVTTTEVPNYVPGEFQ